MPDTTVIMSYQTSYGWWESDDGNFSCMPEVLEEAATYAYLMADAAATMARYQRFTFEQEVSLAEQASWMDTYAKILEQARSLPAWGGIEEWHRHIARNAFRFRRSLS